MVCKICGKKTDNDIKYCYECLEKEIKELSEIIKENPNNAEAFFNRGYTKYLFKKNCHKDHLKFIHIYSGMISDFNNAIELKNDDGHYYFCRGLAKYISTDQREESVEDFNKAIEINSNNGDYYYYRGLAIYRFLGQKEEAVKNFDKAIELKNDKASFYFARACAKSNQIQDSKYSTHFKYSEIVKNNSALYEESMQDFNKAIELEKNASFYFKRGIVKICLEKYEEAVNDFDKAVELKNDDYDFYYWHGIAEYFCKNYEKASKDFNYIKNQFLDFYFYYFKGLADFFFNLKEEALKDFQEMIKSYSCYLDDKDCIYHKPLIEALNKAIELQNDNADFYYWRGRAKFYIDNKNFDTIKILDIPCIEWDKYYINDVSEKFKDALADLNKAIELKNDDAYFYYWRGRIKYYLNYNEAIIKCITKSNDEDNENIISNDAQTSINSGKIQYITPEGKIEFLTQEQFIEHAYKLRAEWEKERIKDFDKAIEIKNDDPYFYYWRARTKKEAPGFAYDEFITDDLDKAIDLYQNDAYFYYWRGLVIFLEEPEKAKKDFDEAIKIKDDEPYFYYFRGRTEDDTDCIEKALQDYNTAIKLKDKVAYFYYDRSSSLRLTGRYKAAIEDCKKTIDLSYDFDPLFMEDLCQTQINNIKYNPYSWKHRPSIEDIDKAIEEDNTDAFAYYWRSYKKRQLAKSEEAEGDTKEAHYKYREALQDINKAIELNPDEVCFYMSRACIKTDLKEQKSSLKDLNKIIEMDPEGADAHVYYWRSVIFSDLKQKEEALNDINKAIELKNEDAHYYYQRAYIKYALFNKDKTAFEDYNKALYLCNQGKAYSFEPLSEDEIIDIGFIMQKNPEYFNSESYYNLGDIKCKLGGFEAAIKDYERVIAKDKKTPVPYYKIAIVYKKDKQTDEAIKYLDKAISMKNDYIEAYFERACCYEQDNKDVLKAIKDYSTVIDLCNKQKNTDMINAEEYKQAYRRRGILNLEQKKYTKANSDFEKYLELNLDDKEILYKKKFAEILAKFNKMQAKNNRISMILSH